MNWIDATWTAMAAACLTLVFIHLLVWNKQRANRAHLAFSVAGAAIAATGVFELLMMHAESAEAYASLLQWAHVPFAVLVVALVAFVRLQLGVGRAWLGHLAWALRVLTLLPNFATGANLNFIEVTGLIGRSTWGGAHFMTPVGIANPWMILGQLSSYVLLAFFLDAAISEWRRPQSESPAKTIRICSSMALFIVLATMWHLAVVVGSLRLPVAILPAFTAVLLVMSYELGGDVIRASKLAEDLVAAEGTIREGEQRIENAGLAAGFGTWEWDVGTGRMGLSARAAELLDAPPGARFGYSQLLERIDLADREDVADALDSVQAGGDTLVSEFRIVHANGRRRWLLARGQREAAGGGTTRLRGVLVDITERKLADEQFRVLVESAPAAILVAGADGRILFANLRAEQDFGWSREALAELAMDQLIPGHALNTAEAHSQGADLYGVRRNGQRFLIEVAISPIELGGQQATLISVTDISERRRMERESAMQRDELAHLSRVALLAELSGSLAHELNQPLTSILSNAQAALRFMDHDPPNLGEVREGLSNIVESDKLAGEVIRRLRTMLRKGAADFQPIDVNDLITDVLRIVRSDLLNKNVKVCLKLDGALPESEGDRVQLQQVLLNLIVNGSDAMQPLAAGRKLTLITRPGRRGGVEVTVSDVGPGIPPEELERIFAPFVTTKPEGMGLGLAVCRTIIDAHGGRLWAANNQGAGASVHFWLPAAGTRALTGV